MNSSWSLEDLRAHIETERVSVDRRLAILGSLDRYIDIFRYHLFSARDAMDGVVHTDDPHGVRNSQLAFGVGERQDEFARARIVSEAHVLGCIHSVRALWDVFAFLVNELVLSSQVEESKCDLAKVWKALPASTLKNDIERLLDSYWFSYVSAFINTSKHRYLVAHSFRVCFESGHAGIRIEEFEYRGRRYPPYWARELLEGILGVKNRVIDCGKILNWQLIGGETQLDSAQLKAMVAMNRWSLLGAIVFGGVFALFTFWRIDAVDSHAIRVTIAAFLFGLYCAIVIFGTSDKRRWLSLAAQTLLGVAVACAIAALFGAASDGYIVAVVLGLVLGFTADWWAVHVDLPQRAPQELVQADSMVRVGLAEALDPMPIISTNGFKALVAFAFSVAVLGGVWFGLVTCGGYAWHRWMMHGTLSALALVLLLVPPKRVASLGRRVLLTLGVFLAFVLARA